MPHVSKYGTTVPVHRILQWPCRFTTVHGADSTTVIKSTTKTPYQLLLLCWQDTGRKDRGTQWEYGRPCTADDQRERESDGRCRPQLVKARGF